MPEYKPLTDAELDAVESMAIPSLGRPTHWERRLMADLREARRLLRAANTFIEYARYELEPGMAKFGDQFPKQGDADKVLSELRRYLAALEEPKA